MTQQFAKSAQERLATWNRCKNSAFLNESRANRTLVANPLHFRLLPHCVATFWNFPEQSLCPQDRAICANENYPLPTVNPTYVHAAAGTSLLSSQQRCLLEHLHVCVQPHRQQMACAHVSSAVLAKASAAECCCHEPVKAKTQTKYAL